MELSQYHGSALDWMKSAGASPDEMAAFSHYWQHFAGREGYPCPRCLIGRKEEPLVHWNDETGHEFAHCPKCGLKLSEPDM